MRYVNPLVEGSSPSPVIEGLKYSSLLPFSGRSRQFTILGAILSVIDSNAKPPFTTSRATGVFRSKESDLARSS
jgi:hypothetical protein